MFLDWKKRESWEHLVISALSESVGKDYARIICENAEGIRYRDDDEEICNLFANRLNKDDIINSVIRKLKESITTVQAYHACRAKDVDSYYKNGLVPLNLQDTRKLFFEIFCKPSGTFSKEEAETAILAVPTETITNVTHVLLDDRFFVKRCGHYLIYGSEYLNCLSVYLPGGGEHTRDVLKKFGKATVFTCRVPFSWIKPSGLLSLAAHMVAEHAYSLAHNKTDVICLNFTITVPGEIPPEMLCSHYHPELIRDPYKQRRIWNDTKSSYE